MGEIVAIHDAVCVYVSNKRNIFFCLSVENFKKT